MSGRLTKIARLATGRYTPFSVASWGPAEDELLHDWEQGNDLSGASDELAAAVGSAYGSEWRAWGTNLGRSAIQLVLEALALEDGASVIVPDYACAGVIVPVIQAGLRPVLVDVDVDLNPSLQSIRAAAPEGVGAIILPHFGGHFAQDAEAICEWAAENGIAVIEDVAQAQGLRHQGAPAGSLGRAAILSFGAGKVLFGPGGGMLVTRDQKLAARIDERALDTEPRDRVSARVRSFRHRFAASESTRARRTLRATFAYRIGVSATPPAADTADPHGFAVFRISGLEAALALRRLQELEPILAARAANAEAWRLRLEHVRGLTIAPAGDNVFTKLWLRFEGSDAVARAEAMRTSLHRAGVETETLYTPLSARAEFSRFGGDRLPSTEGWWRAVFAAPARPGLGPADWRRIDDALSWQS